VLLGVWVGALAPDRDPIVAADEAPSV